MAYTDEDLAFVFNRASGKCIYCGDALIRESYEQPWKPRAWEVDHFIPLANGGADQPENWVPACVNCKAFKGGGLPWEFLPGRFKQGERDPQSYLAAKKPGPENVAGE